MHPTGRYSFSVLPSRSGSPDESDMPSTAALAAPFEALAEAAAAAAHESDGQTPHSAKRQRRQPPPNAFPESVACVVLKVSTNISVSSAVQRGIVSDMDAKTLFARYMSTCHDWAPILDPDFNSYEQFKPTTSWCFTVCLYLAAKTQASEEEPSLQVQQLASEAHGIARSSLFGPTTKVAACQAMLLTSAWANSGTVLGVSHALAMALDFGLYRAFDALTDAKTRSDVEVRELLAGCRTWLFVYSLQHT